MLVELPPLPYEKNALEPTISTETIEYHYGKHHQGYVNKLKKLLKGTKHEKEKLKNIILKTENQNVYNNAAQVFNHTFYWNCMSPEKQNPEDALKMLLEKHFGSLDTFKEEFIKAATTLFGSGWVWLVQDKNGNLKIKQTRNAHCPIKDNEIPLLTCDVWEHAYYIDYRNGRKKYVEGWWNLINWKFVGQNLKT